MVEDWRRFADSVCELRDPALMAPRMGVTRAREAPMSADAGPRRFSAATMWESSELLSEFDNVAVRVGDVERPFMPWPIHRSAEDLDPEPSQPLRFTVYVFD